MPVQLSARTAPHGIEVEHGKLRYFYTGSYERGVVEFDNFAVGSHRSKRHIGLFGQFYFYGICLFGLFCAFGRAASEGEHSGYAAH